MIFQQLNKERRGRCGKLLMLAMLKLWPLSRRSCPLPQTLDGAGALVTRFCAHCGTHCALTFVFFASGNSDGKSLSECTIFSLYLYLQQGQLCMIYPTWCKYQQSDQSLEQEQVEDLFSLASDSVASSEAAVRRGLALARNFRSRHIKYERAMGVSIYKHFDWQHPLPKDRLFLF